MAKFRRSPLLSFIESRKEYLDLNVKAGMTEESESFKNLSVATSFSIQSHVRALAGISPEDANLVISQILKLRLLAAHKQDIVGAINEKVWLAYQDPTEEPNLKQGIDEPEIFLTEDDWDILRSPTSSMRDRVGRLATRFGSLGLLYPTETAVMRVVTLAFLDQGDPLGFVDVALQASRSFKASAKKRRVAHTGPRKKLPNFQQSIQDFEANYPDWFLMGYSEAGPLVPVPVPTLMLRNLEARLACRSTKLGARVQAQKDTKAVACPDPSTSASLTLQVLADFMMRQQMVGVAGPPNSGAPGLQIFAPGSPTTLSTTLPLQSPAQSSPQISPVTPSLPGQQSPRPPSMSGLEGDVTPSLLAGSSPRLEEGAQVSQGPASPGVAGPPVAPQASDLVTKFNTMLQQPKDKENEDEGNNDIVASNKKTKKAMVLRRQAAADAEVLRRPAAAGALVAGPKNLVAGPQNLVAGPQKRDTADFELPSGWTKGKVQRTSGKSAGKWDTYYYNPAGDRFRTKGEVMKANQQA